ncbi:hypothetical protein ACFYWP_41215 [Actinacidiphila glaucinigra]|uniref:hypothetical protein n=1 Tax=Actinacidiphila glaucinigra TaxID=235986 RepID=UPI003698518C
MSGTATPNTSRAARSEPPTAPRVLPDRTLPRLTAADCTPTQWDSAQQKAMKGNQVLTFIEEGLPPERFTAALYRTISQHLFGHMAHFDQHGFAETWFATPATRAAFIAHALNRHIGGDPAYTWSDVEAHIQRALEAHPELQDMQNWPGYQAPVHSCPSCACTS